jgi:hypothetical protein
VDDGMGTIACCLWTTGGYSSPEFELGHVVRVLGKINEYRDVRQLNVHEICKSMAPYAFPAAELITLFGDAWIDGVDDPNMEIFNWLQINRLREVVYSKPFQIPDEIKVHGPELESLLKEQSDGLMPSTEDEVCR